MQILISILCLCVLQAICDPLPKPARAAAPDATTHHHHHHHATEPKPAQEAVEPHHKLVHHQAHPAHPPQHTHKHMQPNLHNQHRHHHKQLSDGKQCASEWTSGYSYMEFDYPMAAGELTVHITHMDQEGSCMHGRNYGVRNSTLWIGVGCGANVHVCYHRSNETAPVRKPIQQMQAGASAYYDAVPGGDKLCIKERTSGKSRTLMQPGGASYIISVKLENSHSKCHDGHGYGVLDRAVLVDVGCHAEFEICFTPETMFL